MGKIISKHINRLLLDPNNYRFIDNKDYRLVTKENLSDTKIQERTFRMLVGEKLENITDLLKSFKANGILNDPIQVRELDDGNYLVVEGNRRTSALKQLYKDYQEARDIGKLTEGDFKSLNVVLISDENPIEHLIAMGIHHIGGKKKWSPVNQAKLIKDLINEHQMSEQDVCDSIGITKHSLRRSIRTLALIDKYKDSDFGDQFQTNMYSIFEEIIKNVKVKEWLEWDDFEMKPANTINEERIFHWISRVETTEEDEIGEEIEVVREPIVTKSHEVRDLSKFIDDPKSIDKMEDSRSITQAYALSDAVGESRLKNAMDTIIKEVNVAFKYSEHLRSDDYSDIDVLKRKLDSLIPSTNSNAVLTNSIDSKQYFSSLQSHFTEFSINKYKQLQDTTLKNTSRVNLVVGANNTGKTSLLEAIFLQTNLNNINGLINLERVRGHYGKEISSNMVKELFQNNISIESVFNAKNTNVSYSFENTLNNIDKSNYLKTISCNASISGDIVSSEMHLYENKTPILNYKEVKKLCNSVISSPFRYTPELLENAHAYAIENQYFNEVIDFIKENIDSNIKDIELTLKENHKTFFVSTDKQEKALSLSQYGEGVQRVFEIGLLIGYCRNGVLCIDELDSAIHKNLLIPFTQFIQRLADKFNTQIFLTTHSKECIDAFVQNEYPDDNLMAYALTSEDEKIVARFLNGDKLKSLVESVNIDIR